ncbi:hypothetical protein EVAR_13504_1 [Eumeta japonica]|uniref:Uncharacterized protein n=1 Tax=Eumeta variegata TaxID=151549 RepID=A0A4C1V014_EUMVA|nr:hypothetical protein EVAR_13504_1 [Eumeta japonica]
MAYPGGAGEGGCPRPPPSPPLKILATEYTTLSQNRDVKLTAFAVVSRLASEISGGPLLLHYPTLSVIIDSYILFLVQRPATHWSNRSTCDIFIRPRLRRAARPHPGVACPTKSPARCGNERGNLKRVISLSNAVDTVCPIQVPPVKSDTFSANRPRPHDRLVIDAVRSANTEEKDVPTKQSRTDPLLVIFDSAAAYPCRRWRRAKSAPHTRAAETMRRVAEMRSARIDSASLREVCFNGTPARRESERGKKRARPANMAAPPRLSPNAITVSIPSLLDHF